jgi:hypothetical protein
MALDSHHIVPVSKRGGNDAANLISLCKNCHDLHHRGVILESSIRAWKMLLLAINEAFDRHTTDLLLMLHKFKDEMRGLQRDTLVHFASLIASGMAETSVDFSFTSGKFEPSYKIKLTGRGKAFVEAWICGDLEQASAASSVPLSPSA